MDVILITQISLAIIGPILGLFGYMLRQLYAKIDRTLSNKEIRQVISDRLGPLETNQRNLEHEIVRIERKLDRITDLLIAMRHPHERSKD